MYKLYKNKELGLLMGVIRLADNVWIPMDESNRDYQEYLKWVAEGNEPLPADE
jgi:hypothetical protein